MALSISQKVVIGKENTFGTATASDSDTTTVNNAALPVTTANVNLKIEPFNDDTKRGLVGLNSMQYPTVISVDGTIDGPFFNDECAYLILALLGKDAVTSAASNQNTHIFSGKTDFSAPNANSLTIDVRDDVANSNAVLKEFTGCYVSSLGLKFSAASGILEYTSTIMGRNGGTSFTMANTTFAEPVPIFGWTGTVNTQTYSRTADNEVVGTVGSCLIDADITINRPTAMLYCMSNTQLAQRSDPGPMEVTAKFTFDYDMTEVPTPVTWTTNYLSSDPANYAKGWRFDLTNNQTGANLRAVRIYIPAASIIDGVLEVDRSQTAMRLNTSIRGLNNSAATINGPVKITLTSRKTLVYGS